MLDKICGAVNNSPSNARALGTKAIKLTANVQKMHMENKDVHMFGCCALSRMFQVCEELQCHAKEMGILQHASRIMAVHAHDADVQYAV